jgi:lipoprotein-anchoring transpeptidase ErfK/SrfK
VPGTHAGTATAFRGMPVKRVTIALAVIAGVVLAAGTLLVLSSSGGGPVAARLSQGNGVVQVAQPAWERQAAVPGTTVLATVLRTSPRYASSGRRTAGTVPASWYARPSVLPVIARRAGWVRVRLAQRPDGSTAWLPASDVSFGLTPYRIVINLARTHLALYDHGRLVFSAPAGVGAPDDPTPAGDYFVAFDEQPPQAGVGYGPFVVVTSAHSEAISDWEGSGDAVIGIHGPLGADAEIGSGGARISHGCVRLHLPALERLADVPPGTPIDIVA